MMSELIETHTLNGEQPDDSLLDAMDGAVAPALQT